MITRFLNHLADKHPRAAVVLMYGIGGALALLLVGLTASAICLLDLILKLTRSLT
jgi:hypothetical protein